MEDLQSFLKYAGTYKALWVKLNGDIITSFIKDSNKIEKEKEVAITNTFSFYKIGVLNGYVSLKVLKQGVYKGLKVNFVEIPEELLKYFEKPRLCFNIYFQKEVLINLKPLLISEIELPTQPIQGIKSILEQFLGSLEIDMNRVFCDFMDNKFRMVLKIPEEDLVLEHEFN